MAALNFPSSPTNGQIYSAANGASWVWNSTRGVWISVSAPVRKFTVRYTDIAGTTVLNQAYTVGYVDVYYNGVKLVLDSDYTATNGTSITLTDAVASASDVLEVISWDIFTITDALDIAAGDARYALIANAVTQAQGDARWLLIADAFTETDADAKYLLISNAFTETDADALYLALDGSSGMAGDIDLNNNDLLGIKTAIFEAEYSTSSALNWNNGFKQAITLAANTTFTFTNPSPAAPCTLQVKVTQASSGGPYTVNFPAAVKWGNAGTPTMTTTASKTDIFMFYFDGTNYYGSYLQGY